MKDVYCPPTNPAGTGKPPMTETAISEPQPAKPRPRKKIRWFLLLLALSPLLGLVWVIQRGGAAMAPGATLAALVTTLPYLCIIIGIFHLALLLVFRNKWLLLPLFLTAALFLWQWGHLFLPFGGSAHPKKTALKVMTWNVQRMGEWEGGKKMTKRRLACISGLLRKEKPDILVLQEITQRQLQRLEASLEKVKDGSVWIDYYGSRKGWRGGLAILLLDPKNRLSASIKRALSLPPQWKYLFVEITGKGELTGLTFNVLGLHVAPPDVTPKRAAGLVRGALELKPGTLTKARAMVHNYRRKVALQGAQARQALGLIKKFKDPTVIMGDFNSTRDAALHVKLRESLTDAWEAAGWGFGSTRHWADVVPLRIDYIYTSRHISVVGAQTLQEVCSDHLPVAASLVFK